MIEKLQHAFSQLLDSIIAGAPKVVVAIILIALGWAVAKGIEALLRFLLSRLKLDKLLTKAGLDKTLHRLGIRQELDVFLPKLCYFLTLLVLAKTAADALGLTAISQAIQALFDYLPNIVAALLLMIVGGAIAQFASDTIARASESAGIDFAPALGKFVSGIIIFVVAMMAVAQLKIETAMIRIVTSFVLGGAALAFGLAFGLGTRGVVHQLAAGFYLRKVLSVGREVQASGQRGVIIALTPTHAVLQGENGEVYLSNTQLLSENFEQVS